MKRAFPTLLADVRRVTLSALAALLILATPARAETVTVLGASSLQDVLLEVADAFEKEHPDVDFQFNFAGTSTLRAQMENGVRFDVFVAADTLHPQALFEQKLIRKPRAFAHNRLVLITRKGWIVPPAALDAQASLRSGKGGGPGAGSGDSPANAADALRKLGPNGQAQMMLESLRRPGTRIVVANETVPAGRYTRAALKRMSADPVLGKSFGSSVEAHFVSLESSVRAVLAKVMLGEADAGFVYVTDVEAREDRVYVTQLPEQWNVQATYAGAVASRPQERRLAEAFVKFLLSPEAQRIFREYRFEN